MNPCVRLCLAHLSLSDQNLSLSVVVVVVVVVDVVVNFLNFYLLLQNHWANFNQTWHKASSGEGDSSCLNEGSRGPFPRGHNYEIWKNFDEIKKKLSSRTTGQFQPNLAQCILGWRGFKFVQMKDSALFQGEIITKWWKYIDEILKSSFPEPLGNFNQTCHKASLDKGDSNFFKWRAPPFSKGR